MAQDNDRKGLGPPLEVPQTPPAPHDPAPPTIAPTVVPKGGQDELTTPPELVPPPPKAPPELRPSLPPGPIGPPPIHTE
jgi:hypothetical protein